MTYPSPPGPRMPYDADGTVVLAVASGGSVTTPSGSSVERLNSEDNTAAWQDVGGPNQGSNDYIAFLFPESRDIVGWYARSTDGGSTGGETIQTSDDTTNGFDGTWSDLDTDAAYPQESISPYYRTHINVVSVTCNAIRFKHNSDSFNDFGTIHLYGNKATYDALTMWKPVTDAALDGTEFDYGDIFQSTTEDRDFRVKNSHGTLTANDVSIDVEALTDGIVESLPPQFTFSIDGGGFSNPLSIGDLGPGVISDVITVRRTTPSDADLALWAARIRASATSWS